VDEELRGVHGLLPLAVTVFGGTVFSRIDRFGPELLRTQLPNSRKPKSKRRMEDREVRGSPTAIGTGYEILADGDVRLKLNGVSARSPSKVFGAATRVVAVTVLHQTSQERKRDPTRSGDIGSGSFQSGKSSAPAISRQRADSRRHTHAARRHSG
jgi:hypothetical protein